MRITLESGMPLDGRILVSTAELRQILSCGKDTAMAIGEQAGAKRRYGRRVLWNVAVIKEYVNRPQLTQ